MAACKECKGTGKVPVGGISVPMEEKCDDCKGSGNIYGYDLMEDLLSTLAGKMPTLKEYPSGPDYKHQVTGDYVISIHAIDSCTYELLLKNLDRIRAEKKERWLSWWVFTLPDGVVYNTKYTAGNPIRELIFAKFFSELEQLEWHLRHRDWYSEMSDDHRVWAAGDAHQKTIDKLMAKLIVEGKDKEVMELVHRLAPKDRTRDAGQKTRGCF